MKMNYNIEVAENRRYADHKKKSRLDDFLLRNSTQTDTRLKVTINNAGGDIVGVTIIKWLYRKFCPLLCHSQHYFPETKFRKSPENKWMVQW